MTSVEKYNLAAIDIGSNATRLLIKTVDKDVDGNIHLSKTLFLRVSLRLGDEVFVNGEISEEKEKQFIRVMKSYKYLMKAYDVKSYRACATSAMGDAKNGKTILKKIEKKTDVKIEIISGEEESQIIYDNHLNMMQKKGNYHYVDVGGGSTETTFINNDQRISSVSYNVGTVRMLSGMVDEKIYNEMKDDLAEITSGYPDVNIVGSGGNINKLFRIAPKKDKTGNSFTVESLEKLYTQLNRMSVEERMETYGFKSDRADVIVPAAEIFLSIAKSVKAKDIIVPNIGLADGLINLMLSEPSSH